KIKEVRLPEGLKELGERSIENCESLTDIYLPSTLETIDEYNFDLCADGLKIHVPAGSNTETLVRKVIENLEYNVEVVPE
ncbi:leucine-rich repeat protein, partial [[Ruminococcus] lactaris]